MPNSATLVQALLAAFCAILCALSGMGGGGMMIGARTAAWVKSGGMQYFNSVRGYGMESSDGALYYYGDERISAITTYIPIGPNVHFTVRYGLIETRGLWYVIGGKVYLKYFKENLTPAPGFLGATGDHRSATTPADCAYVRWPIATEMKDEIYLINDDTGEYIVKDGIIVKGGGIDV